MKFFGSSKAPYLIVLGNPSTRMMRSNDFDSSRTKIILEQLLGKAGISFEDVRVVYAYWNTVSYKGFQGLKVPKTRALPCHVAENGVYFPKDFVEQGKLLREYVEANPPKMIIPMHDIALWMLGGEESVSKWRSSHMNFRSIPMIPTYDPLVTDKMYEWTFLAVHDLKRAKRVLDKGSKATKEYIRIAPSYSETMICLSKLCRMADKTPLLLGNDVETRFGQITCIALAWTDNDCLCIPFFCLEKPEGYWSLQEESNIVRKLRELFSHKNVFNAGQNFNYDRNYIARLWGVVPKLGFDTMCAWHVCYPGLKKSLAFISSMMLPHYEFWKDEGGKHAPKAYAEQLQYWRYNAKDAIRTLQLVPLLEAELKDLNQVDNNAEQLRFHDIFLKMELRGVAQDIKLKNKFHMDCFNLLTEYEVWFEQFTEALTGGIPLVKSKTASPWYRSPTQQCKIFYDLFKIAEVKHPKTRRRTVADQAMKTIAKREPLLKTLCEKITEYNSLGTFYGTFVNMPLDWDNRVRSSYGVGMAETFRCTSSEDNFGFGGNLQNIPTGY